MFSFSSSNEITDFSDIRSFSLTVFGSENITTSNIIDPITSKHYIGHPCSSLVSNHIAYDGCIKV